MRPSTPHDIHANTVFQAGKTPRSCPLTLQRCAAFTLIELLVVLVVITLLLALICPALGRARTIARQTRELSTGSQLMRATLIYATDARGAVLPGYAPASWVSNGSVRDETGTAVLGQAGRRYPWRIAPYLDYTFAGLYDDRKLLERYAARPDYQYVVSLSPSMGINADFIGGNDDNGIAFNQAGLRIYGKFYVQRIDDAARPGSLIVFGSARGVDPDGGTVAGFHRIEAPSFTTARWSSAKLTESSQPYEHGNIHPRFAGLTVVSFLDGHGDAKALDELRDMRLWADKATATDWVLTPQTP
ncbi:MAG: prepilin-type N-terminal cleavage/methylation domain-containing protein [Phycisphaerales bacterium]|nr:prepilin-type N-terminal cleavage/methylation domain-containing protein [Phycisphaerales bacterium]